MRSLGIALMALCAMAPGVSADAPRLAWPVDCVLGQECLLQQFVDHDPGPGMRDFACTGATYDGHKGTDIRVTPKAFARGVTVLAPAAGIVTARRDGMEDRILRSPQDRAAVEGRECGNGIVIDHGDGWETQLCHLAKGSVSVRQGQRVEAGEPLGRIGLSGNTEFRHLHLGLRHNGTVVDPFVPNGAGAGCATEIGPGLWRDPLVAEAARQVTRIMVAGTADRVPVLDDILSARTGGGIARRDAPLLVWAVGVNLRPGDIFVIVIEGPDGRVFEASSDPVTRRRAQEMRYGGRRAPAGGWPPGLYGWQVHIDRDGTIIDRQAGVVRL